MSLEPIPTTTQSSLAVGTRCSLLFQVSESAYRRDPVSKVSLLTLDMEKSIDFYQDVRSVLFFLLSLCDAKSWKKGCLCLFGLMSKFESLFAVVYLAENGYIGNAVSLLCSLAVADVARGSDLLLVG